jgi:hypothetical protein
MSTISNIFHTLLLCAPPIFDYLFNYRSDPVFTLYTYAVYIPFMLIYYLIKNRKSRLGDGADRPDW